MNMLENDCYNNSADCSNKECSSKLRKDDVKERSKRVLEVLSSKSLSYNEIVEQSGLNSRYVACYLNYLVNSKKVDRIPQVSKGARGRPRVVYSACLNANQQKPKPSADTKFERILNPQKSKLPSTVAVEVEFSKLKSACRYEKGGNCKQKREKCALSKCPLVLHIRLAGK